MPMLSLVDQLNEASRLEMDRRNMAVQDANAAIPQVVSGRIDLSRLVADAEAAGFNPLTVLRNGGAAGYATQTLPQLARQSLYTSSNIQSAEPDPVTPTVRDPVARSGLRGLSRAEGGTFQGPNVDLRDIVDPYGFVDPVTLRHMQIHSTNTLPNFDEEHGTIAQMQHEYRVAQAMIHAAQTATPGTPGANRMFRPAAVTGHPGTYAQGPAVPGGPPTGAWGPLEGVLDPEVTNLLVGVPWQANPWFSDAGVGWQNRYGEPGEWLGGVVNMAADTVYNGIYRPLRWMRDYGAAHPAQQFQPGAGAWITQGVSDWWQQANSEFGPDYPIPGFDRGGF